MSLNKIILEWFHGWSIASVTTCGTDCGSIKLRSGETFIRIFFRLNGDTHWTGRNVTVDHIEEAEELI